MAKLQEEGRILNQNFPEAWDDYRLTKMVFQPARMSIDDVYEGFTYLRKSYYHPWETIQRTLDTLLTTKSLAASVIAYKFNASYRRAFVESEHYRKYGWRDLKKKFRKV